MSIKNIDTHWEEPYMTKRILVVDDDVPIVEGLTYLLEDAGYIVETCTDGSFIYKKYNSNKPDLILLDYMLPGENGGDLTRKLKSKNNTKNIPVIIISASHNIEENVFRAGADDFIPKPYDIYELLDTIERHLIK